MTPETDLPDFDPALDLVLVRELNAPRALLWECWTKPEHIPHWFVPKPHVVKDIRIDLRPGGVSESVFVVEGKEYPQRGVYLEVVPNERLVFTDTYTDGWKPNPDPFMTAIVTVRGHRRRPHPLYRHRPPPLEGRGGPARADGLFQRLGHRRRPARSLCAKPDVR